MTTDTPDATAVQAAIERCKQASSPREDDWDLLEDAQLLADACEHYQRELAAVKKERDLLLDSTHRDRTLTRPMGDYPEFMLQAFLDSGIAGTGAAKQAGAILKSLRQQLAAALARERGLREALEEIAGYDLEPGGRPGICPYGCDTPHIARAALAAEPKP